MSWTTLHLRVMTPLFGGDDPASRNGDSPIRVPSIRGVLRFWFRAVAAGHGITGRKALWDAEERVFGSTDKPSPIRLRLDGGPVAAGAGTKPDWTGGLNHRGFHGAQYLLGQGLWKYGGGLTRPYVTPGAPVSLKVRFSGDKTADQQFLLAVWAWLTYGGLGARTRRGFGQLRCTGIEGDLPAPFSSELTSVPDPSAWWRLAEDAIPAELRDPDRIGWQNWSDAQPPDTAELPESPALTPTWWAGRLFDDRFDQLGAALHFAGLTWRNFRAVRDLSAVPTQNTRSPEWISAIQGGDDRYPVAALGLPVGYYSTRSQFKTVVEPSRPRLGGEREQLRRASPVWLRPVKVGTRDWRVFSHAFWARLLPAGSELHLTEDGEGHCLTVPNRELVERAWDVWIQGEQRIDDDFYGSSRTRS